MSSWVESRGESHCSNMNREESRLHTFDTWPGDAPVASRDLARLGFYATGGFLEAECYWCHQRINDWAYGDEIEERHRNLAPSCAFVDDYPRCGNIPMGGYVDARHAPMVSEGATNIGDNAAVSQQAVNLFVEANRLATFKNWPNPNISPQSLAKAGFYYLNRSDQVKCAWCKGIIAKWEKQDNAFEEHQRFFPDCQRVQLGPLIEMPGGEIRDLGIQLITPPKEPKFSLLDARLRTYTNWPIGEVQRPEALAQAGLYYQNVADQVRCFHCNIGLRSWQKEDDPWFEHAKWYNQCQFVRLVKGAQYVREVQEQTRLSAQQPQGQTCITMTINEAMNTPPVLQALEIGIDGGSIRNATQRQLLVTGRPYDTVEDLVKAVFGDRDDEDETGAGDVSEDSEGTGASIVREVSRIITSIFGATDSDSAAHSSSVHMMPAEENRCGVEILPPVTGATTLSPAGERTTGSSPCDNASSSVSAVTETEEERDSLAQQKISPPRNQTLEEENRKLKEATLCKVCLDEEVGVVLLPCGHLVTCVQCAPGVNQCPMCRKSIKGFLRTYLS